MLLVGFVFTTCNGSCPATTHRMGLVQRELQARGLLKGDGVRLVSITQELGDDPMSNMIRQIMALFDEYQSKENAKHTLRAMKENARQGFWNGALPPIGYRIVEAAEQHGHRTKKTLEIDPIQAETVRFIFRLAREGDGDVLFVGHGAVGTLLLCHYAGLAIDRVHDQPAGGGNYFAMVKQGRRVIHRWRRMEDWTDPATT